MLISYLTEMMSLANKIEKAGLCSLMYLEEDECIYKDWDDLRRKIKGLSNENKSLMSNILSESLNENRSVLENRIIMSFFCSIKNDLYMPELKYLDIIVESETSSNLNPTLSLINDIIKLNINLNSIPLLRLINAGKIDKLTTLLFSVSGINGPFFSVSDLRSIRASMAMSNYTNQSVNDLFDSVNDAVRDHLITKIFFNFDIFNGPRFDLLTYIVDQNDK
jgi:hypothetical protein